MAQSALKPPTTSCSAPASQGYQAHAVYTDNIPSKLGEVALLLDSQKQAQSNKMRQRTMLQMKEYDKTSEKELNDRDKQST